VAQSKGLFLKLGCGAGVLVLLLCGLLGFFVVNAARHGPTSKLASQAGEREFDLANSSISRMGGITAFGNSADAITLAKQFSELMKESRKDLFTGGKASKLSMSKGEFLTYCRLTDEHVVFLVHVPELRQYKDDAKESQGRIAWAIAQALVRKQGVPPGTPLAVGLRGAILYGPVNIGSVVEDELAGDGGISRTVSGSSAKASLYPFFITPQSAPQPSTAPAP